MARATTSEGFGKAFGEALLHFLNAKGMTQSDAAKMLGLGEEGKALLNTSYHDPPKGARPKPNAEILYLLCTRLGFDFEYNGYKISAVTLNGNGLKATEKPVEQL